jgi:hypothetical protein
MKAAPELERFGAAFVFGFSSQQCWARVSGLFPSTFLGMFTMKKQIVQVSMLQSAKVVAGLYFVISLPVVLVLAAVMALSAQGVNMWVLVLFPLLQAVVSFLFALLGGWIYKLVASRIGGSEFVTSEVGSIAPR